MYTRKVLVFEKEWVVRWGKRGEGKRDLEILARRGMIEVNGVSLKDVDAFGCSRVDIPVDLPGVERCVVIVADGE